MEKTITSAMKQHKTRERSKLLPKIQFTMNTSKSFSTKFMPYQILFNQKPKFGNEKNFVQTDKDGLEIPCSELPVHKLVLLVMIRKKLIKKKLSL